MLTLLKPIFFIGAFILAPAPTTKNQELTTALTLRQKGMSNYENLWLMETLAVEISFGRQYQELGTRNQ